MCSQNTFDTILQYLCNQIKDVNLISKNFGSLCSDEDRVKLVFKLFNKENIVEISGICGKSVEFSTEFRKLGNEKFQTKQDWESLTLYTKSIAYAPPESYELALAYGNRAACLIHLGHPSLALEDVDRALKLKIDRKYEEKLLKRRETCHGKLGHETVFVSSNELPQVEGKCNEKLPSASEYVNLESSLDMGRKLVTTTYICTGDVLVIEKPYSSILLPESYYTHCHYCYTRKCNLIPCDYCYTCMFCNDECLRNANEAFHFIECSVLKYLNKLNSWKMDLLAVNTLIRASKQGNNLKDLDVLDFSMKDCYRSGDYVNVHNLVGNTEHRSCSDLFNRSVKAAVMVEVLAKFSNFFDSVKNEELQYKIKAGGLILRYLQSFPCNAHEISEMVEDGLVEIGAGAYATLSLINHSCEPNVVRYSYKDVVVLRAVRPLLPGEQLFDNYGYHYATHNIAERQISLLKQYFFQCGCEACSNFWPMFLQIPEETPVFKGRTDLKLYQKLTSCFEETMTEVLCGTCTEDTVNKLSKYLDYLDKNVEKPWKNFNTCQEALKHCWGKFGNHFLVSKSKHITK